MAAYTYPLIVAFGADLTGQAANVRYNVYDLDGISKVSALGTMTEDTDDAGAANTGVYRVNATLDQSWSFPLRVVYTISGVGGVMTEEVLPMHLNQPVPATDLTAKNVQSVGDCLSAARAQAAGAATIAGNIVTLLGPNGETVRTFTTNSQAAPTSRT